MTGFDDEATSAYVRSLTKRVRLAQERGRTAVAEKYQALLAEVDERRARYERARLAPPTEAEAQQAMLDFNMGELK